MTQLLAAVSWQAIGLRAGIIVVALVIWFWTQSLIGRRAAPQEGMGDAVHDWTARLHGYFSSHQRAANAALIVSSLFIDLIGLSLIGAALFGSTFAPFLAVLIVFASRQVCQGLCTLPPPTGLIWRNPGFPAIFVTYGVGNDFFFSGHTALAVLGALEAAYLGPEWLAIIAGVIAVGEMLIVLVLRAHYTMDVLAGAMAAFLAADLSRVLAPAVDAWLK